MKGRRTDWGRATQHQCKSRHSNDQRAAHHKGKRWIPSAQHIKKICNPLRIDHVGQSRDRRRELRDRIARCPQDLESRRDAVLEVVEEVANEVKPGDLVITLGAGDVNALVPVILESLNAN